MSGDAAAEEWLMVLTAGAATPPASDWPLVQGIGTTAFRLLDVAVTDASALSWGDRLSIGPETGDQVVEIARRLTYHELAPAVQDVLAPTIAGIIHRNERRFIECFNTLRLDGLDGSPLALLPGLSAECRAAIRAERRLRQFADFETLIARVECLDRPREVLVERVLLELRNAETAYQWLTE
jgi:predicted nucleic acid-binding OB-fold protein